MYNSREQLTGNKLLKWAGSKSGISRQIVPFLRFDRLYIEPFCGSAAFFFENRPAQACLNDLNSNLIRFYTDLRDKAIEVYSVYASIEINDAAYYKARDEYNAIQPSTRKSGLFIYLNHYCFNGLYRTNKKGNFNTPFGAKQKIKERLSVKDFQLASQSLARTMLTDHDFQKFLDEVKPMNSCIYLDPPYFTDDERVFGEYGAQPFTSADLERLTLTCKKLATNNRVVVSYRKCSEFVDLFSKYIVSEISVVRNVGGFRGRRKLDTEMVAVMDFKECVH